MSLPSRLLGANPSIQVSTLLSGTLTTPSAKGTFDLGSFDSIATTSITSNTTTVTFSTIPATYTHLQIRFRAQSGRTSANSGDYWVVNFNSDAGANYYYGHQLSGDGATASSYANGAGASILIERIVNNESGANVFTPGIIDILDYANTNKFKTTRSLLGYDYNGGGQVNFASGLWRSTAAISNITLSLSTGPIKQYSRIALYGIKG